MQPNPILRTLSSVPRRFQRNKLQRFVFSFMLIGVLLLLIAGLQNLELRGAIRKNQPQEATDSLASFFLTNQTFFVVAFILLAFFMVLLVVIHRRSREIKLVLFLFLMMFVLLMLPSSSSKEEETSVLQPAATPVDFVDEIPLPEPLPEPILEDFAPPQLSGVILYGFSLIVILSLAVGIWLLYRFRQPHELLEKKRTLDEIGESARLALEGLDAGLNEHDVVIACYAQMSEIVSRSRNLDRAVSRTATEFAMRLEVAGLPGDAVRRLTSLFEVVRYGRRVSQQADVDEARSCLSEIAHYCGVSSL